MAKSNAQKLFQELAAELSQTHIEGEITKDMKEWVDLSRIPNITVRATNKQLEVVVKGIEAKAKQQGGQFIDLKPIFAKSAKAKQKKDGGWYLIIPIGAQARTLKKNTPRSLWDEFSHTDFGTTMSLPNLQKALGKDQSQVISQLQYQWKSNNVTRVAPKSGKGIRGRYIAFRTVSDKSSPSSWIVGRQNFKENDPQLSQKMQDLIGLAIGSRVKEYKAEQLELL